ncbi:iron-containing alcohol dehydrogenase [Bordetella petrii]|uniref:maleylacetate reductase n=1 Tax=Bordetella petrii TaxID=94624 RepID=A0A7T3UXU0_9BORD|nr:iron-containing alcohol dehydrogenase [Bordetella petrii]QPZ87454.1 maleylacetate reductase [Bordetella petrii]
MKKFTLDYLSPRVVFGAGTASALPDEIGRLGARRPLVLSSPEQRELAKDIVRPIGDRVAGYFDGATMHVPVDVIQKAERAFNDTDADSIIAIGGGSTTGLAKILSMNLDVPSLVIPTTYAGSEMTTIWGVTEGGMKRTGRDPKVLPKTVIYDPLLTVDLPLAISVTSALNAIAHAAEGLYSADLNPVLETMCKQGICALFDAIPRLVAKPTDAEARTDALFGAWMCGTALCHLGMGLHHKLCHTLGGTLNLPHAETHAIVLPHALAYNLPYAAPAERLLQEVTGSSDVPSALYDLARNAGAPLSLAEIGMRPEDIPRVRDLALRDQYPNPRPLESDALETLLVNAFRGRRPDFK